MTGLPTTLGDSDAFALVDKAIAAFDRTTGSIDDFVMLLLHRADLAGIPLTIEQVASFLVIEEDEALDIFSRLAERGFIERDDS